MQELTNGSLFSGIGGLDLGLEIAGIKTLWQCEIEKFQQRLLKQNFPDATQYKDIRDLRNPPTVNVISGGFPCQDISLAGKGAGIGGSRSRLWLEMWRICGEVRPDYILIENSTMLLRRGFERVLCDLSEIGYDAEWQCLSGADFGLQTRRERVYVIAYRDQGMFQGSRQESVFRKPGVSWQPDGIFPGWRERWQIPEPRTLRTTNGIPDQMDRIEGLGNAVMPFAGIYLGSCIKRHREEFLNQQNEMKYAKGRKNEIVALP